jgi:hypothetical protein
VKVNTANAWERMMWTRVGWVCQDCTEHWQLLLTPGVVFFYLVIIKSMTHNDAWSRDQLSKLIWDGKPERTFCHIWKNVLWLHIVYWEWEEDTYPEICQKFLWFRYFRTGRLWFRPICPISPGYRVLLVPFHTNGDLRALCWDVSIEHRSQPHGIQKSCCLL